MKTLRMSPEELLEYFRKEVEEGDRLELNYAFVHIPGEVVKITRYRLHLYVESEVAPGIRRYDLEEICSMMLEVIHEPKEGKPVKIVVEGADESPGIGIL
ncbi:DUF2097 domain-containing protein [Methanopyrus kandleri]|uniref:Uncharacterized protein conserved in archaea n=2 Tax=Methanopyrus kandleri TaxID=2320 RepID=Q8TV67_METKA|nr:DUF2097 domain-containing protein [Methanopyrus kandleri]AAM02744.1 Uncharacterized protein conserved in archaea [Methanopyrus kandleri AV19]HII71004.1 DUF2097 family protein [Methanopyrus kandleri]